MFMIQKHTELGNVLKIKTFTNTSVEDAVVYSVSKPHANQLW